MVEKKLLRPYLNSTGKRIMLRIPVCHCKWQDQRGKEGGVCGACGNAIPDAAELKLQRRHS